MITFTPDKYFIDWDLEKKIQNDIKVLLNEDAVKKSIHNILTCEPGELPWNPDLGCSLKKYLFAPLDPATLLGVHDEVYNALSKFEPRITNLQVIVTPDYENQDIIIEIRFVILGSNKETSFKTSLKKIR